MKTEEEIRYKIAELEESKKTWVEQVEKIKSKEVLALPPYVDMVTRELSAHANKINALGWSLGEIDEF